MTDRFIRLIDLLNAVAMVGMAGKYMFAVRGLLGDQCARDGLLQQGSIPEESTNGDDSDDDPLLSRSVDTIWFGIGLAA